MLTATLEPLIKECQQAIEFAQDGDHSAARGKLDRVRYLRSVISRSRVDAGPNDATPKLSAFDTPDLLAAQTVAAEHVNRLLEILREGYPRPDLRLLWKSCASRVRAWNCLSMRLCLRFGT